MRGCRTQPRRCPGTAGRCLSPDRAPGTWFQLSPTCAFASAPDAGGRLVHSAGRPLLSAVQLSPTPRTSRLLSVSTNSWVELGLPAASADLVFARQRV